MTRRAAGILFLAPGNQVLFLKRGNGGDHPGEWCFPGGHSEGEETTEETAARETREEIGSLPKGERALLARRIGLPTPGIATSSTASLVETGAAGSAPPTSALAAPVPTSPADVEPVDFSTFLQPVKDTFEPTLSEEHVGFAWAPVDAPPEPLHPGARVALARLSMDELGVARAIRDGELTSPQRYENVTLWAIRITGTGVAYRRRHDEFVWRDPSIYLNDEFLARCNGLSVIFQHPKKNTLDSETFGDQVVGSILLPYIVGDEVWGIAKIYDDATNKLLSNEEMSTSPAVVFRDPTVNEKIQLEDGKTLLIEGKPSLVDHVAICLKGVWDKQGERPPGINSETAKENTMTEEEKKAAAAKADAEMKEKEEKEKADRAKADAEAGTKLDKILSCVDSLTKRMDAFEDEKKADKARKDAEEKEEKPEPVAADKAKKDAEEKEAKEAKEKADAEMKEKEEKEKADKAKKDADEKEKADADLPAIRAAVDELRAKMPKQLSDADYAAMADAQARADTVYSAFGKSAPRPLDGESVTTYRRRLAVGLKDHSVTWKGVDLAAVADSAAFGVAENMIYADAMNAALNPTDLPENELRSVVRRDTTGREITTFHGHPSSWMGGFSSSRRRLAGIRNERR